MMETVSKQMSEWLLQCTSDYNQYVGDLLDKHFNEDGTPVANVIQVWVQKDIFCLNGGFKYELQLNHLLQLIGEPPPEGLDDTWIGYSLEIDNDEPQKEGE